ncbi:acetylcholine receptor subunit alpha-like [Ruditapes philippinarum]|uniref:acetylcholine receptor subunit alpha-like n=1 Tax=Ruditapes philippinarum TaxID=129788 RepID=UPI00295ABEC0|nr:acetylcholine receptor subunit alpha-like [Ruditapes philippinarum]
MARTLHFVVLLFLNLTLLNVQGSPRGHHHESLLHKYLFHDYNVNVRPVLNHSEQVDIIIRLSLRKIQDLDEKRQSIKCTINLDLYWKDEFLTWNSSEYGGIKTLVFPYSKNIWVPDIMVYNALVNSEDYGMEGSTIQLYQNGQVYAWTQVRLNTECEIKSKKYPFDEQICTIILSKFMNTDERVMLKSQINEVLLLYYEHTAEWEVIDNYVTTDTYHFNVTVDVLTYTFINYKFKIKRACRICLINVIIPVLILASLNLISFFIPCESGEKTSFPISIFLTMAVFLTIISREMPESIDGVSYLSSYVTVLLGIGAVTTLCSALSLRFHFRARPKSVSKFWRFLVKILVPVSDDKDENKNVENDDIKKQRKRSLSLNSNKDLEMKNMRCSASPDVTWKQVSLAFDRLAFFVMLILEVISTVVFLDLMFR